MKPWTRLVHADIGIEDPYRASSPPLYQTATFAQESAVEFGRYDYTRSGNPTRAALERALAELEGAERAFAFASGMAALATLLRLLPPGSRIVAGDDLYGGTFRLLEHCAPRSGLEATYVDATDVAEVERAIDERTRLVLVETPTNPRQRVCDLRALARLARDRGVLLAVDNSLMSPWLQRPLELGADVVVHSATKHLGGHGDAVAGALCVRGAELAGELAFLQNAEGNALAPFESWLVLRGMQTLGVRLERAQASALEIARHLERCSWVTRVHCVGLQSHPGHRLHASQADGPGSLVSFETGDPELSRRLVEALQLFTIAVSFGSTRSLVSLPCWMSHRSLGTAPADGRNRPELPRDLVRLAVGLEDSADLIADLDLAVLAGTRMRASPNGFGS